MVSYDIRDRLTTYLKSVNLTVAHLESLCGFSNRYFNNVRFRVPSGRIDTILRALPDLNRRWLLTGEGEMTNNLPLSSPVKASDSVSEGFSFLYRVEQLLEMEGLSVAQFEDYHRMEAGIISKVFAEGDMRDIDRLGLLLLREYPKYSYDWLFLGDGPALKAKRRFLQIVERPSAFFAVSACQKEDNEYVRILNVRSRAEGRYLVIDPDIMGTEVSFALELKWDDLSPYANFGDVILCQLCEPSAITKDDRNLYVVECGHADQEPDLRYGYLKLGKKGISVIPLFELSMSKMGKEDDDSGSFVLEEDIIHIARIVGVVHKFRMR